MVRALIQEDEKGSSNEENLFRFGIYVFTEKSESRENVRYKSRCAQVPKRPV